MSRFSSEKNAINLNLNLIRDRGMKMKMTISYLEGWRFSSKCRSHEIISDQPIEEDGQDTGMTPVEMFISSIGCCMGVYAKMFCDRHKIPMEDMNIVLEWNMAKNPSRVGELQAKIVFKKNIDTVLQQGIIRMVKHCTVHNTMNNPPEVNVSISIRELN
ncbi:OsmC family protein [[Eubacterium] cellulosolvens]